MAKVMNGFYQDREFTLELALGGVGPGWAYLVTRAYRELEKQKYPLLFQVKEKFGGLRFYVGTSTEEFEDFVAKLEKESFTVCEECGAQGTPKGWGSYWIKTLCPSCGQKRVEWNTERNAKTQKRMDEIRSTKSEE